MFRFLFISFAVICFTSHIYAQTSDLSEFFPSYFLSPPAGNADTLFAVGSGSSLDQALVSSLTEIIKSRDSLLWEQFNKDSVHDKATCMSKIGSVNIFSSSETRTYHQSGITLTQKENELISNLQTSQEAFEELEKQINVINKHKSDNINKSGKLQANNELIKSDTLNASNTPKNETLSKINSQLQKTLALKNILSTDSLFDGFSATKKIWMASDCSNYSCETQFHDILGPYLDKNDTNISSHFSKTVTIKENNIDIKAIINELKNNGCSIVKKDLMNLNSKPVHYVLISLVRNRKSITK